MAFVGDSAKRALSTLPLTEVDLMQATQSGRAIVLTNRGVKALVAVGLTGFMLQQASCPIVSALAANAPSPKMVAWQETGDFDACAPCTAGANDCFQQLIEWLEAQVRGDPTVPFPDDECMDTESSI